MESCAAAKAPVTVANVSALPKTGGCLESTVSVMTETVTNMTASSAQGMGCAIVATVSAGTAGQGTLAKSGWEQSTKEERTLVLETRDPAARSNQSTTTRSPPGLVKHHSLDNYQKRREKTKLKHGCDFAYH